MPYQIDSEDLVPQPTAHEWTYPRVIGNDGDGAPVYGKYVSVAMTCDLMVSNHDWYRYMDGGLHTVTVPEPGDADAFTTYGSVYVQAVEDRRSHSGKVGRGIGGITMTVNKIEV